MNLETRIEKDLAQGKNFVVSPSAKVEEKFAAWDADSPVNQKCGSNQKLVANEIKTLTRDVIIN